jgi:hypothetical protein
LDQIEFYDVKKRAKVSVSASQVKKTKYERPTKDGGTQVRYALKAEVDGSRLTKFVSKETWDQVSAPEV